MKTKILIAIIAPMFAVASPSESHTAGSEKTIPLTRAALAIIGVEDTSEVIEEVLGTVAWEPICLFRGSALVAIVTEKGSVCSRADESLAVRIKPGSSVRMEYHKVIFRTLKPQGAAPQQVVAETYVITKVEGEPPAADLTVIPQEPQVWEMQVRVIGPITVVDKGLCLLKVADAKGQTSSAFINTSGEDGQPGFGNGDIVRMAVHCGSVEKKDADGKVQRFKLRANIVSHGKLPSNSELSLPFREQADPTLSPIDIAPATLEEQTPRPKAPKPAVKKKASPPVEEDCGDVPYQEALT